MRGFSVRRLLQFTGYAFSAIGVLLLDRMGGTAAAWPALECGVIEAAWALDRPTAYACLDKADYDPLIGSVTLIAGMLLTLTSRLAPHEPRIYIPTETENVRNRRAMIDRVRRMWVDDVPETTPSTKPC